jgi:cysteine-rich repeat protein
MIFNRSATALVAGGSAFVLLLVLGPSVVRAQQQTKEQQRCINTMNKSGQKVLATQGKENSSCVKNAGKNKLSGTAQDCLIADPKLKLSKATQKTIDGENKKCTVVPSFAKTDAATVNAAAQDEEISLTADIFGNPLDTAIIDASVDKIGAACQAAVAKGYEKLTATYAKTFNGCKKDALKNLASNEAAIAACLGDDPKGKIGKAEAKLAATPAKKCVGVDQTTAFPGACSGAANMTDCVSSIEARARCRTCQSIALQDGFSFPACDDDDDGVLNGSCRQCGNSVIDVGETCDDGGIQTAACEANCTTSACTDGILNALAGEQCDDGNSDEFDGCTNDCTTCGDEIVTAPEECDDGNLFGGDGCSAACTCSGTFGEFGCQDTLCPDRGQLLLLSGTSAQSCSVNADCTDHSGVCDSGLSRCVSATGLDSGYSGISHGADIVDNTLTKAFLVCPGPAPTCGQCALGGVDPTNDSCRCADDNRTICDEPFQSDADDCAGATCNCYLGPPLPLSAGNTPACIVSQLRTQPTGIVNIDNGEGDIQVALASIVFLGENLVTPCPYCTGDITAGDGVRDGVCVKGDNEGASCDVDGDSPTFPAPGGDGSSLDCFPDPGKNVSGTGLKIALDGSSITPQQLDANVKCGFEGIAESLCPCSVCDNDGLQGCTSNADCMDGGVCEDFFKNGVPLPNTCSDDVCSDLGGNQGECDAGPSSQMCDGILRADGGGFIACLQNLDCAPGTIGIDAGDCTIVEKRKCFLDPIIAIPNADPIRPIGAAAFCIAPTSNPGINTVAGLPGPARVLNEGVAATFCFGSATEYMPGVGGCP